MEQAKYLFISANELYVYSSEVLTPSRSIVGLSSLVGLGFKPVLVAKDKHEIDLFCLNLSHIFESQGIVFDDTIALNQKDDGSFLGADVLVAFEKYLVSQSINLLNSYVIGNQAFHSVAQKIGIQHIATSDKETDNWQKINAAIISKPRTSSYQRISTETQISLYLNLDDPSFFKINTGIHFLDHLIEQLAKHSGIGMELDVKGDLHIDDHHTVEDIAIVIGNAIREALGDKLGINRFGFVLPLDESKTLIVLDLSNRPHCTYRGTFPTEMIGDLSTQMVEHFFFSFADGLRASLHVDIQGENSHHMAESAFKSLARTLKQAVKQEGVDLPSTKGLL